MALSDIIGEDHNPYTGKGNRTFRPAIVIRVTGSDIGCIIIDSGGSDTYRFGFTADENHNLSKGSVVLIGVDGFNSMGFIYADGKVYRNYDEKQYDDEHQKFLAKSQQRRLKRLESCRDDWTARESYLSQPMRDRLNYFRLHGKNFELEGWGYELVIAEIADMFVASNLETTADMEDYFDAQGASGNQVGLAKALARGMMNDQEMTGTVGGLSVITGEAYY